MNELTKDELDFLFHKTEKHSGKNWIRTIVKNFFRDSIFPKFFIVLIVLEFIRNI
ncbi:hypothetical protein [Geosporobacter ferrireducens]|uniref:hypothetical protein n=1 Tax=Geosporobacter ferrireducens TaxID=1424294 RepID=UPI0012EA712D|nr:hypothetical protein [Geosporobacter ferrireducens]